MSSTPATIRTASAIGLVALSLGLLAQLLFVEAAIGVNVPISTAAVLLAGWIVRDSSKPVPRPLDAWFAPGALILSAFVALRGDPMLLALDVLGAIALTSAALASFSGVQVVERSFPAIMALAAHLSRSALVDGGRPLVTLARTVPMLGVSSRGGRWTPVARGVLIAAPLVLLFVILFASADAVFSRLVGDLLDWHLDLGSLPGRLVVAVVAAWLTAGLLVFVSRGEEHVPDAEVLMAWERRPRLGATEAVTVLIVLDLLFATFVALQGAYLFGGRDTLAASGLTYAEYARRGFFELLAVALVVGGLTLALESFVRHRTRAYLVGAISLVILTVAVLASALLRLRLYQEAYGWTELRFYVLAAIAWLAIGSLTAVLTLATDRSRWLPHGMLVVSFAFALAFNLIGPVRLVAERNIERAIHPELVAPGGESGLDVAYLASLGDDAIPVLAEHLCDLPASLGAEAEAALADQVSWLRHDEPGRAWQAWNLSRERGRDTVIRTPTIPVICLLSAP